MLIITFKYRYRKQIVIGIFILFLLVGGTILTIFMFQSDKKDKSDLVVSTATNSLKKKSKKENIENYKVDIKGEILTPGIYTLKRNSRVIDQTTLNMIQDISSIIARKPMIIGEI